MDSSQPTDRLYNLLPVVYRLRDADQGYPLRSLLAIISEQVNLVEEDIAQLYENWFIETSQDWVVPYIADLIGYRPVHSAGEPGVREMGAGREALLRQEQRERILIPRREVANTLRFRRSKGTLALLELLANSSAGWLARAVEFYRLLGWAQHLDHQHLPRGGTADLRQGGVLERIGEAAGAFDPLAHTVDVRRTISHRSTGRYNIPSLGVFVFRLKAYSVTKTPGYCLEIGPQNYTFSVLGNDTPLYNRPQPESSPTHIAGELNLPIPITRRAFEQRIYREGKLDHTQASPDYYGLDKSLEIYVTDWPRKGGEHAVPASAIIPADLSDWRYRVPRNFLAVDPQLGRIVFPSGQLPKGVRVYYHYAFSADMGGGEYDRPVIQPEQYTLYRVGRDETYATIRQALDAWMQADPRPNGVIEVADSGVYTEQLNIVLGENESLQIRAANRTRPVIRLLDYMADRPDAFSVSGRNGSRFTLDGLLVTGRGLMLTPDESDENGAPVSDLCQVTIRHCTLVPGWAIGHDCEPKRPNDPSLELVNTRASVRIERSIIGSMEVTADEVRSEPVHITIHDSIVDATRLGRSAISAANLPFAYAVLEIARCTVLGEVQAHAIQVAEDSLFLAPVRVARRQQGCVRFSYVTPGSRTPRRYNCQPDLVEQAVEAAVKNGDLPLADKDQTLESERLRVRPAFNSTRYGVPTYCQLSLDSAVEIRQGASDESEMGAFHDLYQPQRQANLRARLDEYTPSNMEAGIIFVT